MDELVKFYTPEMSVLMKRGTDYLCTSHADANEAKYASCFWPCGPGGMPDEMKPNGSERIRWYLTRTIRKAPDVIQWVNTHYANALKSNCCRTRTCPWCSEDYARRTFERRFVAYLVDWYFVEVGRCCVQEED